MFSVTSDTTLIFAIHAWIPIPNILLRAQRRSSKALGNFIFGFGQDQVQAQSGFPAQPGLQQVQVKFLGRYSIFWPENHFTPSHFLT